MSRLFLCNQALNEQQFQRLHNHLSEKDEVVLIEDAVYSVLVLSSQIKTLMSSSIFLFKPDCTTRGLKPSIEINYINNYSELVDFTEKHHSVISWAP